MEQQALTGLSRISAILVLVLLQLTDCFSQKSIVFSTGAGINQTIPGTTNAGDLSNDGKGRSSYVFEVNGQLKFSNHFSLSIQYMMLQSHIRVVFDDLTVSYYHHQSQTGGTIGNITFRDDLYLYGNAGGLNFNYELPFQRNNFVFGLGINRIYYNSTRNYMTRNYDILPTTSKFSTIAPHQSSDLSGPKLTSLNAALSYERFFYKDKIGFFAKLTYIYNIYGNSFEYRHSDMGLEDNYYYTYGGKTISTMRYYTLAFQNMSFAAGILFKINFKTNEEISNN